MYRIARALLLMAALGFVFSSPAWAFKRTHVGEDGYEFHLETLDGGSFTLSENLAPTATLIIFWAAWSPRSHEILADYQKFYKENRDAGLQIVAVNVEHPVWDPTEFDKIKAAVADAGASYPVVLDKDYTVFNDYGVVAVPSTVMMDNTGTVIGVLEGYATMTRDGFREEVLRKLGLYKEPVVDKKKELAYKPKGTSSRYYMMGKKLAEKKRFTRAVTQLEKAVEIDPEYADAYRELARVYDKLKRPDEAATALARAEELDAANPALAVTPEEPTDKAATSTNPDAPSAPDAKPQEDPAKGDDNSALHLATQDKTAALVAQ